MPPPIRVGRALSHPRARAATSGDIGPSAICSYLKRFARPGDMIGVSPGSMAG